MNKSTQTTMKLWDLYSQKNDGLISSDITMQREIVYDASKQSLVIDSIINDIPLPAFYLWKNQNGKLEVLDGKQRIESISNFIHNKIMYNEQSWSEWGNNNQELQKKFKNTNLSIIICEGDEQYKRTIFNRINTLGVPLSKFEVINGLHPDLYLEEMKEYVRTNSDIKTIFEGNSRGNTEYFLLTFLSKSGKIDTISQYITTKTNFSNDYKTINKIVKFINTIFQEPQKFKKQYFNLAQKYQDSKTLLIANKIIINKLIKEFSKSKSFKLVNNIEKWLDNLILSVIEKPIELDNKRLFNPKIKEVLFEKNKVIFQENETNACPNCNHYFLIEDLEIDHIKPWSLGGTTTIDNAQLLCKSCNSKKSNKVL